MKQTGYIVEALLGLVSLLGGCYYDKSELVYPPGTTPCDTAVVTYGTDIVGILSANCYRCHSGTAVDGSGIKLDSYTAVSTHAKFGSLLQVVQHVPGFPAMPKDGNKLSNCNIAIIRTWIRNGSPNN